MTSAIIDPSKNPFFQTLIENSDFGILALDAGGRIIVWNPWIAERTSVPEKMAIGKTLSEALPGVPETTLDAFAQVIRTGQPRILSPVLHSVLIPLTKPFSKMGRLYPVQDGQGRNAGIILLIHDMSQAMEYERFVEDKAAAELRNRDSIFHAIGHPTFILDREYRILSANQAAASVTGCSVQELTGRKCYEIMHGAGAPAPGCPCMKMRTTGVLETSEMEVETLGRLFFVSCSPLFDAAGNLEKIIHVAMDITARKQAEKALRESEALYRTFINATTDMVFLKDDRYRNLIANHELCVFYGKSEQEIKGRTDFDLMPQAFATRCRNTDEAAVTSGTRVINEEEVGGRRFETNKFPVQLADGKSGVGGFIRDITDSKQTEGRLRESEENFRRSLEDSPLGARIVSAEGETIYANRILLEMYGYGTVEELYATSFLQRYTPESYAGFLIRRERRKRGEDGEPEYEIDIVRKDGEVRRLQVFRKEILWNGRLQYQVLYNDVTRQRKVQEALNLSEERYHAFVKQSSDAICLFEIEHEPIDTTLSTDAQIDLLYAQAVIRECNRIFATSHGYGAPEEMFGFKIGQIFPRLARVNVDYLRAFIENGHHIADVETKELARDGMVKYFLNSLIGHVENGRLLRVWGAKQDISRIKRIETDIRTLNTQLEQRVAERTVQLEASNQELEAFAYSVSHDLRAPLRAVDGYTRILVEDFGASLDDEGRRVCSVISESARNMGKLIDDLLALSRIGRAEMQHSPIDMTTMANSIFFELTTPKERDRIDFKVGPLPQAQGDPTLIRQVWANLIGNAVKFSSKKERAMIAVGCRSENESPPAEDGPDAGLLPSGPVYFIRDTGAGFNMVYAEKLFGVFQRLHSAKEFEGTGVGLAIVHRIIHRHGGRIWANGEVGKGAVFYFTITA